MSTYEDWSKEDLINRIKQLESQGSTHQPPKSPQRPPSPSSTQLQQQRWFHFASHPRRKIALKFCYSGWEYNGLAYQTSPTPLPTVEGVLFDALVRAKLIDPSAGYEGCGWEKCGRTDRGVSSAGQVISLWIRSALGTVEESDPQPPTSGEDAMPEPDPVVSEEETPAETVLDNDAFGSLDLDDDGPSQNTSVSSPSPASRPELAYVSILNRILPPSIRVLAWSPVSPTFSARFNCKYRHYKYFFSSENLDIPKMQEAASRLLGEHDFRNLCKVDAGKQITVFVRKILKAEIVPVDGDDTTPKMHVLNLVGTAFLYHQVRHIMAVLFMVGRGLEEPSVVTSLLNVREGAEQAHDGETLEVVDRKPEYQMADALPLVLWDCAYSADDVDWRVDGYGVQPAGSQVAVSKEGSEPSREDGRGMYHLLHSIHARSQIFTTIHRHFLDAADTFFSSPWALTPSGTIGVAAGPVVNYEVPLGGGASRKLGNYVPLLKRTRLDPVEVINERWRLGKGSRRENRRKDAEDEGDE
ncbi:pseudouridine synthase deg1 [Marasmius crinis-equi]|uniref:Pseudouridine synthase deg1 n=1 Tax=Marasmius crinis-equi TaxID=585013 RepID=A0ABR3FFZ5_9AGAR